MAIGPTTPMPSVGANPPSDKLAALVGLLQGLYGGWSDISKSKDEDKRRQEALAQQAIQNQFERDRLQQSDRQFQASQQEHQTDNARSDKILADAAANRRYEQTNKTLDDVQNNAPGVGGAVDEDTIATMKGDPTLRPMLNRMQLKPQPGINSGPSTVQLPNPGPSILQPPPPPLGALADQITAAQAPPAPPTGPLQLPNSLNMPGFRGTLPPRPDQQRTMDADSQAAKVAADRAIAVNMINQSIGDFNKSRTGPRNLKADSDAYRSVVTKIPPAMWQQSGINPDSVGTIPDDIRNYRHEQDALASRPPPAINAQMDAMKQNISDTLDGIQRGDIPPVALVGGGRITPIQSMLLGEASRRGMHGATMVTQWNATQKAVGSMNSAQQQNLQRAVGRVIPALDMIQSLSDQLSAEGVKGGMPMLNSAYLKAAKQGVYGKAAQDTATLLDAQIADAKSEIASVLSGGYAPKELNLDYANQTLNSEWTASTLNKAIDMARRNLAWTTNAARNVEVRGVGDQNPYYTPPGGQQPSGRQSGAGPGPAQAGPPSNPKDGQGWDSPTGHRVWNAARQRWVVG